MVKTAQANPGGLPKEVFDGFQAQSLRLIVRSSIATSRRAPSMKATIGPARNLPRRSSLSGKPGNDMRCESALLSVLSHSQSRPISPMIRKKIDSTRASYARRRRSNQCRSPTPALSAKLLKNSDDEFYPGFLHGMPTTNADTINADLLCVHQGIITCWRVVFPGEYGQTGIDKGPPPIYVLIAVIRHRN